MTFARLLQCGCLGGAMLVADTATLRRAQSVEPAPMGVPGYSGAYAQQGVVGYTVPVNPGARAPVVTGRGAPVVVRNTAPTVPGYVASYSAPASSIAPAYYSAPASYSVPVQAPGQVPATVGYRASYEAPIAVAPAPVSRPAPARARFYNPVGFGFGGYSYGEYPAYGYNGYLPAAYDGYNVSGYESRAVTSAGYRGVSTPAAPGGYSTFNMSDAWTGYCGPNGCRMNYRPY